MIEAAREERVDADCWPRFQCLLNDWAKAFAQQADLPLADLAVSRRGWHNDEVAGFLAALDAGHVTVDPAGFFRMSQMRVKRAGGRYSLFTRGQPISVNLEYMIQVVAGVELHERYGWPAEVLDFERGEYDVVGYGPDGRIVLAVEAKARVSGPDSLERLLRAFLKRVEDPTAPIDRNAARKYDELVVICREGPVLLWLVAAGARWLFNATATKGALQLDPTPETSLIFSAGSTAASPVLAT